MFNGDGEAASQTLYAWNHNQDPAEEPRSLMQPLKELIYTSLQFDLPEGPYHSAQPFRPRKQTHTQTLAGRKTTTPVARQPSSAPYPSRPKVRTRRQSSATTRKSTMRIPQQTSYEITEIKLRDVSIKLGSEWRTVGTYLGFCNSQIEVIQEEYRVIKECIFQMLLQWRNTNGFEATKEKLKKALRRSLREDLADFIDEADD